MDNKEKEPLSINFDEYRHISVKNNRLLVKPLDFIENNVSAGGIVMSASDKKPHFKTGVVLGLGAGRVLPDGSFTGLDKEYAIGDVICFGDMSGIDVKLYRGKGKQAEELIVVDVDSVYYVDGEAKTLYVEVVNR